MTKTELEETIAVLEAELATAKSVIDGFNAKDQPEPLVRMAWEGDVSFDGAMGSQVTRYGYNLIPGEDGLLYAMVPESRVDLEKTRGFIEA